MGVFALPKINIAPENRPSQIQPSIFRGENVSFREGTTKKNSEDLMVMIRNPRLVSAWCLQFTEEMWNKDRSKC